MSAAEELIKQCKLTEALADLKEQVKKKPADGKLRVFLFQLFALAGDWERSLTQLNVCADLKAQDPVACEASKMLLQVEAMRQEVFAGKRTPLVFGEPEEWIGMLLQAADLTAKGEDKAAAEMRSQAFESAPAIGGNINGDAFEWIADGDARLGPCIEVVIEGKYYWLPLMRVAAIEFEPVTELRNLLWHESTIKLTNGGTIFAFLPARYPGTVESGDEALMLSRKTDWREIEGGAWLGLGQKTFVTDSGDYPLLEVKKIEFSQPDEK